MTTFYFIRHGEPDYEEINRKKFIGHGRDLAPLTEQGIRQIRKISQDDRLKECDIIISSPYTRALQSAAIISKELDMNIKVEVDLHEWLPDKTFQYKSRKQVIKAYRSYYKSDGININTNENLWEDAESMKKRAENVLSRYLKYKNVIVVCHAMIIRTFLNEKHIKYGEIIEYRI